MNVAIAIGAALFLGAFYSWTSRINGMFFFGRSTASELRDSAEGRAITRQYRTAILVTTAVAILAAWAGGRFERNFAAIGPLGEAAAFWAIFARANGRVRALERSGGAPAAQGGVIQVPLLETPSYRIPSWPAALVSALLGVAAFGAALLLAGQVMDLRADWTAWNSSMEVRHLDLLLGMGVGMLSAATALLLVFRSSIRLRTNMAQYTIRAAVVMEWAGLAVLLAALGCNYVGFSLARGGNRVFLILGFVAALGTIVWNQARAKRFVPAPVELGADDRWRWGLFYVDRNDPALFVQSRCGAGYTLNYGRMVAWPISLGVLVYLVSMLFLASMHR